MIPQTTIRSLAVFVSARRNVFSPEALETAWKIIRAAPPTTTIIDVGLSVACEDCLLANRNVDLGAHWPVLIDALQNLPHDLTVRFWEWTASSQTAPQMADPFATPENVAVPSSYELKNALLPCRQRLKTSLRSGLAGQMERVTMGACVEIM